MTKLTYANAAALIADFKAGAKFAVNYYGNTKRVIESIEALPSGKTVRVLMQDGGIFSFKADGSHITPTFPWTLLKTADAPSSVPLNPLIERFLGGEEFYTPHTREIVVAVGVHRGHNRLDVTLRDEAGKERTTPRYNKDGTHKHRSERNLVAGKLPPKTKIVKVTIYKHAFNGSLFVIREGEVLPSIRGISNAQIVGETEIAD